MKFDGYDRVILMIVYSIPYPVLGMWAISALGEQFTRTVGYALVEVLLAWTLYLFYRKYEYKLDPKITDEAVQQFWTDARVNQKGND